MIRHREKLIFDQGSPGRSGASLPPSGVPEADAEKLWPAHLRRGSEPQLPEVSEVDVIRHFTRLSRWNFFIDAGFYPLGSCTMKYNPKINEHVARLAEFASIHPLRPQSDMQGSLEVMWRLEQLLREVSGFERVTLQPAAGAHGELCGLMLIVAYHRDRGRRPSKVLIPDSAHGTNPASVSLNHLKAITVPTGPDGLIHPDALRAVCDDDVAALMLTNPSTLGLFEEHVAEIAEIVHAKGGLVYMDGANFNALMGKLRPGETGVDVMHFNLHKTFTTPHGGGGPGSGPVGVGKALVPFLPTPTVEKDGDGFRLDFDRPKSIGRLRSFYGNFGMHLRAYAYIREMGAEGLTRATELAVLNANYLRVQLQDAYHLPHDRPCMHEVVFSDKTLKRETGVQTLDVAKRLMDYGFHPPTIYFPLVVPGALMIEPTETETPETLDEFVHAMRSIAEEAKKDPALVKSAPHDVGMSRLDETRAARKPKLRWQPEKRER